MPPLHRKEDSSTRIVIVNAAVKKIAKNMLSATRACDRFVKPLIFLLVSLNSSDHYGRPN